jgi:hypothetical protein
MVIGKLSVLLGLQSAQFDRGTAGAVTRVQTLESKIKTTASVLPTLQNALKATAVAVAALGAAAIAAAVTGFKILHAEMKRIDAAGKIATKLGIATRMFGGLAHAADLSGIAAENLDTSLVKMSRGLATAATSGGPIDDVLRELQLDSKALAAMTPDAALYRMADSLQAVENPMDRTRIATQLFGRAGADMLLMLAGGSKGLAEMQADAEQLGLTFNDLEFRRVEQANDAIRRLEQAMGALKRQAAIGLAPLFTVVAETITTGMVDATAAVNDHTSALAQAGKTYGILAESVFFLADQITNAERGITMFNLKVMDTMAGALEGAKAVATMLGQKDKAEELGAAIDSLKGSMARLAIPLAIDIATNPSLGEKMRRRYQEILDEVSKATDKPTGAGLVDLEEISKMEKLQRKGEALTAALRTPSEVLTDRIRDANNMLDLGAIGWQTYTREIAAARSEYEKAMSTFSGGPELVEKGSQAAFADADRWQAMQDRMKQPMPGADLVRQNSPAMVEALEKLREINAARPLPDPFELPGLDMPRPKITITKPTLPTNMDLGTASLLPRFGRRSESEYDRLVPREGPPPSESAVSRLPRLGGTDQEQAAALKELVQESKRMAKSLEKIESEAGLTTNATSRTANSVERIEAVPVETVEM